MKESVNRETTENAEFTEKERKMYEI